MSGEVIVAIVSAVTAVSALIYAMVRDRRGDGVRYRQEMDDRVRAIEAVLQRLDGVDVSKRLNSMDRRLGNVEGYLQQIRGAELSSRLGSLEVQVRDTAVHVATATAEISAVRTMIEDLRSDLR